MRIIILFFLKTGNTLYLIRKKIVYMYIQVVDGLHVIIILAFAVNNLFCSELAGGIDTLTKYFEGDQLVSSTLHKFSWALTELQTYLKVPSCML